MKAVCVAILCSSIQNISDACFPASNKQGGIEHCSISTQRLPSYNELFCECKLISCFLGVGYTLHQNAPLSVLQFCEVFYAIANMRTSQRTVFTSQRFIVLQRNRTKAITTSPFLLSLLYRAENRRFSTLRCTKTGGTQPKLSAACFVVQSCLADADFVVFSNYCLIGTRQKPPFF